MIVHRVYFRVLLQWGQMLHVQTLGGGASISYVYTTKVTVIVTYVIMYSLLHYNTCIRASQISGGGDKSPLLLPPSPK